MGLYSKVLCFEMKSSDLALDLRRQSSLAPNVPSEHFVRICNVNVLPQGII